jgi:hypothetical protein
MDQRFGGFFLEKYRLQLQRGARPFYEEEVGEEALRPNKLRRSISRISDWLMASSKMLKKKDSISMEPTRITNQNCVE